MSKLKSLLGLGSTIVALFMFMLYLRNFDFGGSAAGFGDPKSLAATGFIVLAAFSMGEFFKLLKIPALLGYIAAGVMFGPNLAPLLPGAPEALFDKQVIYDLTLVNVLTVGVIGTMGGGELKISDIKDNLGTITLTVIAILLIAAPLTFGAVVFLDAYASWMVPFLSEYNQLNVYAVAALFSVFAVAMSPAATLAIFQESKASGSFTSLVLGIVVVADLTLVALFLLVFQLDKILISPEGFSMDALSATLPTIAAEFGWALVIGVVCGLVFIIYLRFIEKERLFFTVAIIFATSYVAQILHAEVLLAFLTAGFIVQNFSKQGHDMIHALEKISLPVFVIYFMTQAAQLDLKAVAGFLWLTLVLTVIRGFALYAGSRLATTLTNQDDTTKRHLWLTFFSRGGVDLVLAAMVANGIPTWGPDFQTAIMAIVVVHIVAGPPLLNKALDWAGQTEGARAREAEDIATFAEPSTTQEDIDDEPLPEPVFEDEALNGTMHDLREFLISLHAERVTKPLEHQVSTLSDSLKTFEEALDGATDAIRDALGNQELSVDEKRAAVEAANMAYLARINSKINAWEDLDPVAVPEQDLSAMCEEIRGKVSFDAVSRVQREAFLFDAQPDIGFVRSAIRAVRRVRRSVFGSGWRTVPVGRLWRYYVELTVTRSLAGAVDASAKINEPFWAKLGAHFRSIEEMFDDVELHLEDDEVLERWEEEREAASVRALELDQHLERWATVSRARFASALRGAYSNFLDASTKAGTIELPSFAYRPSTLFDRSRRAEAEMVSRVREETRCVTGHRGWVLMEFQLVEFMYWQDHYEDETRDWLTTNLTEPVLDAIVSLRERCDVVPDELGSSTEDARLRYANAKPTDDDTDENDGEPIVDWNGWLESELRHVILRTRRSVQRSLAAVTKGVTRERLEVLENRIESLSEKIEILSEHPDQVEHSATPTLMLPMREWFRSEVARETALRYVEFNERAEALFRRTMTTIESIQQVIEFNLITAEQDSRNGKIRRANDLATGGLARSERLAGDLHESISVQFEDLMRWLFRELDDLQEAAARPLFDHEISTIERRIEKRTAARRAEGRGSVVSAAWLSTKEIGRRAYQRYEPVLNEFKDDVEHLLLDEPHDIQNADIRARLHPYEQAGQLSVPAIYRRLFTPNPLDIPDFYVNRLEVEGRICQAVRDWESGKPNTILLHGDRGVGKRSMMRHLIEGPLRNLESRISRVVIDEHATTESAIARSIGGYFSDIAPRSLEDLKRLVQAMPTKPIVLIENGEKLFTRTREGMALCRSFLRMIDETADRVLWIVLMGTPAATLLQTAIEIQDYFTHAIFVEEFEPVEIREIIERRHRVSGFRSEFDRVRPRFYEWIASPLQSSEIVRDPESAYFDRLAEMCHGNPLLALEYWLESLQVSSSDPQLIFVAQLPEKEPLLLEALSLHKRLILAALVQHNALASSQLNSILGWGEEEIVTELDHLERLGFIEGRAGREIQAFQVRDVAEAVVTRELRLMNMI